MSSPKRFGPFVLERLIGRGGMGAVYRAHREDTGQVAAVKALLLPMDQERERFSAEIATMKLLRHDNIVRLYGFGQEDGVLYYAMEYVDGPSLSTLLKRGRRFCWEEVVHIGASICRALKHAHDRGVVHRDIKPANILLMDEGLVKVSDYGIAQYFGSSRLTGANQVVGTIEYMAPEQARAGALSPHTDMYALGALMYVLLTGKPPYPASDLSRLLQRFKQGPPEPIRFSRPEVPKVVDEVVFDLLQIETSKRPGDARVIGRRLEAILKTSPNFPEGNPFQGQSFSLDRAREKRRAPEPDASRVDLENPSETVGAQENDQYPELSPDFPYRSITDDEIDDDPRHDRPTEPATGANDDFDVAPSTNSSQADFSLSGETTHETAGEPTRTSTSVPVASSGVAPIGPTRTSAKVPVASESADDPVAKRRAPTVVEDVPPKKKNPPPEPVELPKPVAPPKEETGESEISTDEMEAVPLEKFKRSQFTPVDETELDALPAEIDATEQRYAWIRAIVMLLVLLGGVALAIQLFKTPGPESMYRRFDQKLQHCKPIDFDAALRRAEKDMKRFVDVYPNEPRAERVRYFLAELELEDLEQRLERQLRDSGKSTSKLPVERAYLDARRSGANDKDGGADKLRAFIVLFGSETTDLDALEESFDADDGDSLDLYYRNARLLDDPSARSRPGDNMWRRWSGQKRPVMTIQEQLVYVAERRLFALRRETKKTNLSDLALLNDRLGVVRTVAATDPERAEKMREAAVALYGDAEWAESALEDAKRDLENPKPKESEPKEEPTVEPAPVEPN